MLTSAGRHPRTVHVNLHASHITSRSPTGQPPPPMRTVADAHTAEQRRNLSRLEMHRCRRRACIPKRRDQPYGVYAFNIHGDANPRLGRSAIGPRRQGQKWTPPLDDRARQTRPPHPIALLRHRATASLHHRQTFTTSDILAHRPPQRQLNLRRVLQSRNTRTNAGLPATASEPRSQRSGCDGCQRPAEPFSHRDHNRCLNELNARSAARWRPGSKDQTWGWATRRDLTVPPRPNQS